MSLERLSLWVKTAAILAGMALSGVGQERERSQIPERFTWNLAGIYPSIAAWRTAKEVLAAKLARLEEFRGKLATSGAALADALDRKYEIEKELSRQVVYASLLADLDMREAVHQVAGRTAPRCVP